MMSSPHNFRKIISFMRASRLKNLERNIDLGVKTNTNCCGLFSVSYFVKIIVFPNCVVKVIMNGLTNSEKTRWRIWVTHLHVKMWFFIYFTQ